MEHPVAFPGPLLKNLTSMPWNSRQRWIATTSQNDDCHDGGEGALDPVVERSQVSEVDDAEEAELQVELPALAAAASQPLALGGNSIGNFGLEF